MKEGPSSFYPEIQNEEAWLPSYVEAHFSTRVLLFANALGDCTPRFSDYKKFRMESGTEGLKDKK